ncbi:MAG: hypothetical protein HC821_01245 [Lewinella sp.]|nr:hypothetical protein [Lewinella sp.]
MLAEGWRLAAALAAPGPLPQRVLRQQLRAALAAKGGSLPGFLDQGPAAGYYLHFPTWEQAGIDNPLLTVLRQSYQTTALLTPIAAPGFPHSRGPLSFLAWQPKTQSILGPT